MTRLIATSLTNGKRIVILGAGFGGLATANTLRKGLGQDHQVILIEKKTTFMMGLVNLWILQGFRTLESSQTPLAGMNAKGVEYLNDVVIQIDTGSNRVQGKDHGWMKYDYLVIALGSELAPEKIDGFVGRGFNLYDPAQIEPLREKLLALKRGRVAILVMGMPYKCPPAPYEAAMIIDDILSKNGTRSAIEIEMYVPSHIALPVVGPKVSNEIVDMIGQHGVRFNHSCKPKTVRDSKIEFEGGRKERYDVLVGIPPHRSPDVIKTSGLTEGEWIPVDPLTLRTSHRNVFALGDVAEVKPSPTVTLPKAGIFAEGQAKVVAQEIIDDINGRDQSVAYDGKGFCFLEVGDRKSGFVEADFFIAGGPTVRLEPPSLQNYEKKTDFERSRLREWLL